MTKEKIEDQIKKLEKDLELTKDSIIKKWAPVWAGVKADAGNIDCPLCWEYNKSPANQCQGCPIHSHTGLGLCEETPYMYFKKMAKEGIRPRMVVTEEDKKAAEKEVMFLRDIMDGLNTNLKSLKKELEEEKEREKQEGFFTATVAFPGGDLTGDERMDLKEVLLDTIENKLKRRPVRYMHWDRWYLNCTDTNNTSRL